MRRTSKLLLTLDDDGGPLHRRLYRRMRGLIMDGTWPAGTRLPSSRILSEELGVSRNTALHAIELLVADGWIHSRRGSAMYVTHGAAPTLSHLGTVRAERAVPREPVPFEFGRQTAEFFPAERWNRLQARMWNEAGTAMLYGANAGGWPDLCRAIAAYVGAARGLSVSPDQVIVVSSTQAAIDLVTRVLGRSGDQVWVEDPGYPLAHQLFRTNGLAPVPIPVDADGLRVAQGMTHAPQARFAYVTPACHFPTGRTMGPARRAALIAWAREREAWIIEDDWEWHAHFDGAAPPPLQASSGADRVIYIQTFNRTIFPGLRIAFLIAPRELVPRLVEAHERIDGGPNVPVQATLAAFLEEGLYAAHLRVTRAAYAERRAALLGALQALPPGFVPRPERAGLHLLVATPPAVNDARFAADLRGKGIACMGISEFALANESEKGLALGFAAFPPEVLQANAARLVDLIGRMAVA